MFSSSVQQKKVVMSGRNERLPVVPVRRNSRASKSKVVSAGPSGYRGKGAKESPTSKTNELPITQSTDTSKDSALSQQKSSNKKVDSYCWTCHEMAVNQEDSETCNKCPRTYHIRCLRMVSTFSAGVCPECRRVSVDGSEIPELARTKMMGLLPDIVKEIAEKWKMFEAWPCNSAEKNSKICNNIDLARINDHFIEGRYDTTASFLSDIKWIYHNLCIVYGPRHKFTLKSKILLNDCRSQLMNLESCSECFLALRNRRGDGLTRICSSVHKLVWVKLRGYPFWPAKVLKVIDRKVCVIFFGTHERSRVSVSDCYALSKEHPGGIVPKRESYAIALAELKLYIENHVNEFGSFLYASPKTPFELPSIKKSAPKRPLPVGKRQKGKKMRLNATNSSPPSSGDGLSNGDVSAAEEPELIVISDEEDTSTTDNIIDIDLSCEPETAQSLSTAASGIGVLLDKSSNDSVVMDFYAEKGMLDETPDYRKELLAGSDDFSSPESIVPGVIANILEVVSSSPHSSQSGGSHGSHVLAHDMVPIVPAPRVASCVLANPIVPAPQEASYEQNQSNMVYVVQNVEGTSQQETCPDTVSVAVDLCTQRIISALEPVLLDMCNSLLCSPVFEGVIPLRIELKKREKEIEKLKMEKDKLKNRTDLLLVNLQYQLDEEAKKTKDAENKCAEVEQRVQEIQQKLKETEAELEELKKLEHRGQNMGNGLSDSALGTEEAGSNGMTFERDASKNTTSTQTDINWNNINGSGD